MKKMSHLPPSKLKKTVSPTITAFLLSMPFTSTVMADNAESVQLDSIDVVGEQSTYNVESSASNKFTAPLLDTAKSVNIISQSIISDTGSTSLQEALRTVPGITFGAAEGGNPLGDHPFIRGIDSQNSISVDGLRDIAAGTRETFNTEQIEVIKGADSAMNGRAGAGGSINIVTKLPKTEDFRHAEVGLGTDSHLRTTVDMNRAFDNGLAVRLNAMGLTEDVPGREGPENKRWGVAPSITFGLGSPTRVTLAWYHLETNDIPDGGIPYSTPTGTLSAGTHTYRPTTGGDRNNWYGLSKRDDRDEKTDQLTGIFEHDINDDMTVKNTFRFAKSKQDYIWTQPDDSKGNVNNGLVWRRGNARLSETETVQNLTELTGKLTTGFVNHSYSTGIELSRERSDVQSTAIQEGDNTCPNGAGAASNYTCTSLSNPSGSDPWLFDYTLPDATNYETKTMSAYVFDTLELTPQWLVNGGVRYDHYDSTLAAPGAEKISRQDNLWNYQVGLVFKPTENGSIYTSYSTSSTPGNSFLGQGRETGSISTGGRRPVSNADQLKPEKTRAYEIGTKWNFFDEQLSTTLAIFRNEVTNARISDPNDSTLAEMAGEKVVDGFEVSATGRLTSKWDVFAGYTFMDSEQKDIGESNGIAAAGTGEAFPNTPRHSFSMWSNYQFTPKLNAGLGLYAQSDVIGSYSYGADSSVLIEKGVSGYARYDAMVNYIINKKTQVQLNVFNMFDKEYYSSTYSTHYATIANGRSAVATLKVDF